MRVNLLGMMAVLLGVGVLTDVTAGLPLIGTDRGALIVMLLLGGMMCGTGAKQAWVGLGPRHPITLIGFILGLVILLIGGAALFGQDVTERGALMLVGGLMAVKWLIALGMSTLRRPVAAGA
jgi:hypothetical protein